MAEACCQKDAKQQAERSEPPNKPSTEPGVGVHIWPLSGHPSGHLSGASIAESRLAMLKPPVRPPIHTPQAYLDARHELLGASRLQLQRGLALGHKGHRRGASRGAMHGSSKYEVG